MMTRWLQCLAVWGLLLFRTCTRMFCISVKQEMTSALLTWKCFHYVTDSYSAIHERKKTQKGCLAVINSFILRRWSGLSTLKAKKFTTFKETQPVVVLNFSKRVCFCSLCGTSHYIPCKILKKMLPIYLARWAIFYDQTARLF